MKPLSGISAGGKRCRRAGNRSLRHILATIAAGGHSSSPRRERKRDRGGVGGNLSKLFPVWQPPTPQRGKREKATRAVRTCGRLWRCQGPRESLDTFSGLSGEGKWWVWKIQRMSHVGNSSAQRVRMGVMTFAHRRPDNWPNPSRGPSLLCRIGWTQATTSMWNV